MSLIHVKRNNKFLLLLFELPRQVHFWYDFILKQNIAACSTVTVHLIICMFNWAVSFEKLQTFTRINYGEYWK